MTKRKINRLQKSNKSMKTLRQRYKINSLAKINRLDELYKIDKLGSEDSKFLRLQKEHDLLEHEFDRRLAKRRIPVVIYSGKDRIKTTIDKFKG